MRNTLELIEAVERLGDDDVTGGPATINYLHDLATAARLEQSPVDVLAFMAERAGWEVDPERFAQARFHCDRPSAAPVKVRAFDYSTGQPLD